MLNSRKFLDFLDLDLDLPRPSSGMHLLASFCQDEHQIAVVATRCYKRGMFFIEAQVINKFYTIILENDYNNIGSHIFLETSS